MPTVFDDMLLKGVRSGHAPARTQKAKQWYRNVAKGTQVSESELLKDKDRTKKTLEPGSMFMFQYDPKTKDTLPFYDRFPLIFPVELAPGGFYGINLHYLPHRLRAKLMDALYSYVTDQEFTEKTKIALTYKVLKSAAKLKLFQPCFKRYLFSHVESNFIYIYPSEWDMALFLPLERFEKKSMQYVHNQATKKVYG